MSEESSIVKVDDVIIDEQTGEILEFPEGLGDRLQYLTQCAAEAKDQEKVWAQAGGIFRAALGKLLDEMGQKRAVTQYGIPNWRSRTDVRAKPDKLPQVIADFELGAAAIAAIYSTAKELDAGKLLLLSDKKGGTIPHGAIRGLMTENPHAWVQVDKVKKVAPEIERQE